jgi:hypothetical protein
MIPRSGMITLPVTIKATSLSYENQHFVLQISSVSPSSNILSTTSPALFVITHRLIISEPSLPSLWYKDQGGRNNYLKVTVKLINSSDEIVLNRRVHLVVSILYESDDTPVLVPNQEILTLGSQAIIGDPGYSTVLFRVEEVSRSHQNQNFIIRLSPDLNRDPKWGDISPVETTPIHVMSKARGSSSKRGRERCLTEAEQSGPG